MGDERTNIFDGFVPDAGFHDRVAAWRRSPEARALRAHLTGVAHRIRTRMSWPSRPLVGWNPRLERVTNG